MKPIRVLALAALFAAVTASAANVPVPVRCGDSCIGLVQEAHALAAQGKYMEALARYDAAARAEPQSSIPLSSKAGLPLDLSMRAPAGQAESLRTLARDNANRALALAPDDPLARDALRMLDDGAEPSPLHMPAPQAAGLLDEAEKQFAQRHLSEALQKYQAAMKADPQASSAWVGAGDCDYLQEHWAQAETMFRHAATIEPRNSQAWRYLADALYNQGKRDLAEAALVSAIAADPSQSPNWIKLASLRTRDGLPLKPLGLRRGVTVRPGANGKFAVEIENQAKDAPPTPDLAFRVALGVNEANLRAEDQAGGTARMPYDIELASWRMALKVIDEAQARDGKGLTEPALLQMQALARDGQLEPAILLLMFRPSYRPALEAWEAAHPDGVKAFIDRYGLRP